jgi:hypothetical protein
MPRAYIETIFSSCTKWAARQARQAPLILGDQLRIEGRQPVARHLQRDLAGAGQHCLAAVAIASVAAALAGVEMMVHRRVQSPLRQRLLQLVEQTVLVERRLRVGPRQQLIEHRVGDHRLFASRHTMSPLPTSLWPTARNS